MNHHPDLGFTGAAGLRGFALAALAFVSEIAGMKAHDFERRAKKLGDAASALKFGGERALEVTKPPTDMESIAVLMLGAPGVVRGFIQQTLSLDQENVVRVPGGAGAWIHGHVFRAGYRVFIHTGSKFAEATHEDLLTAVRDAFERTGLKLPKGLEG